MINHSTELGLSALTRQASRVSPCAEQHLRNFMVIEDLYLTKGECLGTESWSEAMSVFVVNSGVGKIKFSSGEMPIRENSMVQLPTDKLHTVSWEGPSFSISGISFTDEFIEEMRFGTELLPNMLNFTAQPFRAWDLSTTERIRVQRQIGLLADYSKRVNVQYGRESLAHAFLAFLFDMESLRLRDLEWSDRPASRKEIYVQRFIKLVQLQFRKDRAIKDYAGQLNLSAKYLTQLVKQYTGKNASELIAEQVIKEAKALLRDPQLSIAEVADRLYFSDQSFFGKYFKRQTGISPKSYRGSVLREGLPVAAHLNT